MFVLDALLGLLVLTGVMLLLLRPEILVVGAVLFISYKTGRAIREKLLGK